MLLDGLQFCFRMDEAAGNRIDTVSGLVCTPSGTIGSTTGKLGSAVNIGGGSSWLRQVSTSSVTEGNGAFTVCSWVNYNNISSTSSSYPMARWDTFADWTLVTNSAGRAGFIVRLVDNVTNTNALTPENAIIPGQWHLFLAWFNPSVGANGTCYFQLDNGDVYSTLLGMQKNSVSSVPLAFGVINSGIGGFGSTNAKIDLSCKWSRNLSPSERARLWNNGNGRDFPFSINSNNIIRQHYAQNGGVL